MAAATTDRVLSGVGHGPAANYASAVNAPSPLPHDLRTNGMSVITGRTIFYSGGVERIVCPHCGAVITFAFDRPGPDKAREPVAEVIDAWHDTGLGAYPCSSCHRPTPSTIGDGIACGFSCDQLQVL